MTTGATGKRHASDVHVGNPRAAIMPLLGTVVAGAAWVYLVLVASKFGRLGLDGQNTAWWFLAAATLGAVGCMVLVFVLVARVLRAWGIIRENSPPQAGLHRRNK